MHRAAAWVAALAIAGLFLSPMRSRKYSPPDLQQFWFAGKVAASGIDRLYDRAAYAPLVAELEAQGEKIGAYPFNRPAFAALVSIPISWLPYRTALLAAAVANLALAAILVWKLPLWLGFSTAWRPALAAFLPFLYGIGLSQDILLLTLAVAGSFRLASRGREVAAGVLLGLCLVKPHLIWLVPLALKRRMLWSFLTTGGALALVSFALVGPGGVSRWIALLQAPSTDLLPESMANLRAVGLHWGVVPAALAALLVLALFFIKLRRGSFPQQLGAAIVVSLLLSPHTYHYDLSLLAVAAGLSGSPAARALLLIPWAHFLPGPAGLPWVGACLFYLAARAKTTATSSA